MHAELAPIDPLPLPRIRGLLFGAALGDALGLPYEGMSTTAAIRQRERNMYRRIGWRKAAVSDDTEQMALLAESPLGQDCLAHFRRSLIRWFLRLPFGIGFGTMRACLRLCVGKEGSSSAGNGAMMRAPILGVLGHTERREIGTAVARLTHSDERAVDAALFAAEVSALCLRDAGESSRIAIIEKARGVANNREIGNAIEHGLRCASQPHAARALPNTGFSVHSVALCTAIFVRSGHSALTAIDHAITCGGDTDTHAAIVGAWVGGLRGDALLPAGFLHNGPFGRDHLGDLALALSGRVPTPKWSRLHALWRNLSLYPLILGRALTRWAH